MALTPAEKQKAYRERQQQKIIELSAPGNVTESEIKKEAQRILKEFGCDLLRADEKKQLAGHLIAEWFPEFLDINVLAVMHTQAINQK